MGDEIFIGAVRFNSDDIDPTKTQKTVASNGKTLWSVFLKNGTTIRFYDQKPNAKASVMVGYDQGNENKYGTAFHGIKGLIIEGSEKDDYYHLMDCDYYKVNTKGGGKDEVRAVNTNGEPKSRDFSGVGAEDNAYQVDISHGISRSEGFFLRTKPNDEVHTPPPAEPDPNAPNPPKTVKENLVGLTPGEVLITKQNNELREYHDAQGNTVIRYDGMNDDPEEYFGEEEVISPDGKLISYTQRFSLDSPDGVRFGNVAFDKYEYDENENLVRCVTTTYQGGKLVSTKVTKAADLQEQLIGTVMPGIVIEDQEKLDFLKRKGVHLLGRM